MIDKYLSAPRRLLLIAGRSKAELVILLVCWGFFTQTGLSTARVFDVVGPELIPKVIIGLIAALVFLQIFLDILRNGTVVSTVEEEGVSVSTRVAAFLFIAVTISYLLLLALSPLPYFLSTALFFAGASLTIVGQINVKELAYAVGVGLLIGGFLQFLFTQIFVIDLPT
jgi:hypothetical protein